MSAHRSSNFHPGAYNPYRTPQSNRRLPSRINWGMLGNNALQYTAAVGRAKQYQKDIGNAFGFSSNKTMPVDRKGPRGTTRVNNSLAGRSSIVSKGRNKLKHVKKVHVSKGLRAKITKVIEGHAAKGKVTCIKTGFIGSMTSLAATVTPTVITSVILNGGAQSYVSYPAAGRAPAGSYTWFNHLVDFDTTAAGASILSGSSDMNYWTYAKLLDFASALFNRKAFVSAGYLLTGGNLATKFNKGTGAPQVALSDYNDLRINVKSSSVVWNMKNVSQRTVLIDIYECTPIMAFEGLNPLQMMINAAVADISDGNTDSRLAYSDGFGQNGIALYHDGNISPHLFKGFKFRTKKTTITLAPDESLSHTMKGPSGVVDFGKFNVDGVQQAGSLVKGFSMSCLVGVRSELTIPATTGQTFGGRAQYVDAVTAGKLSGAVSIEVIERISMEVPDIAGFTSAAVPAGSQQMLNNRKEKIIIGNFSPSIVNATYSEANEENPLLSTAASQFN